MKPSHLTIALALSAVQLVAEEPSSIRFSASVPQGKHRISDRLPVEIKVENTGKTAIYVYGDLNYFITVFAATAEGKDIAPDAHFETTPPPPGMDSFTKLEPGHSLSTVWREDLKLLGIHSPGKYQLNFEYRSNLGPEFSFGLSTWNGRKSTSVPVTVLP